MAWRNVLNRDSAKAYSFVPKGGDVVPELGKSALPSNSGTKTEENVAAGDVSSHPQVVIDVDQTEDRGLEEAGGVASRPHTRKSKKMAKRKPSPVEGQSSKKNKKGAAEQTPPSEPEAEGDTEGCPSTADGMSIFTPMPEPSVCHAQMLATAPKGWIRKLREKTIYELACLQSCSLMQSVVVDNVLNDKARDMAKDIEGMEKAASVMKKELAEGKTKLKEMSEALRTSVEESAQMIEAKEEIAMLRGVLRKQGEELAVIRKESTEVKAELEEKKAETTKQVAEFQGKLWEANQAVEELRTQREQIITQVIPHVCKQLMDSWELGTLIADFVNASRKWERAIVLEELAAAGKVVATECEGYDSNASHTHDLAAEALATATFPYVQQISSSPEASVEGLLAMVPRPREG